MEGHTTLSCSLFLPLPTRPVTALQTGGLGKLPLGPPD